MSPVVSVIIPCFNSGKYLPDALESVKSYPDSTVYEVIIINDGSTDLATISLLKQLQKEGYVIIHQENQGPAAARNTGVKFAKGEYILFLDSDNKIKPTYIEYGLSVLDENPDVGVVYGNAHFFGSTSEKRFTNQPFDIHRMLQGNYIDMCSIIRKKVWKDVGGLDEARILIGHEDWDFWVRVGDAGWKFYYINEVLFEYRVLDDSLVQQVTSSEKYDAMLMYFKAKHIQLLLKYLNVKQYKSYLINALFDVGVFYINQHQNKDGLKYIALAFYHSKFNLTVLKHSLYWVKQSLTYKN